MTIHRLRVAFKKFRYMVESLQPLLDGISRRRLDQLHDFQTRMGEIQDAEVLRQALNKFETKTGILQGRFLEALRRRQAKLTDGFIGVADQLFTFWPLDRPTPMADARKGNAA